MHKASGGCHCGNIRVELELTRPPGTYIPRACDCDFCLKHGAAYVSDARGSVLIRIKDQGNSEKYRQGSGQAEFLFCRTCGVLVGVLHRVENGLYATINVNATDVRADFGTEQPASPKNLSANEKTQRWQEIWFANVNLTD
jgi:hypothetical protein